MSQTKSNRKPKFRRVAPARPLLLTARDVAILNALARYRFLTSDLICALNSGSAAKIRRRLQLLFHGGYIDRPKVQIKLYQPATNDPFIYALASKGAKALNAYGLGESCVIGLTNRNKTAGRPYIQHCLSVARIVCAFERMGEARFIPQARISLNKPLRWQVTLDGGREVLGVVPDHTFGLIDRDGTTRYFFLEADTGTMPITRTGPRQTSLLQKVRAYLASNQARIPQQRFGISAFRVLFVLPNRERLENFRRAIETETGGKGAGLFLLGTEEDFAAHDPFEIEFINGRGEPIRLGAGEQRCPHPINTLKS